MFKKILILGLLIIAIEAKAQNDGAGNTGLAFLKLGVGARALAMGEAYSSLTSDGAAVFYNPARLNSGEGSNVLFMYNSSMLDMTTNYIGAKTKYKKLGLGIGIFKNSINDIEVRNIPGEVLDKFNAQNMSLGISISYEVYKNLSIGVTSKMIYEKIYVDEASGVGFDVGANYAKDNFSFSAVVSNFGYMNELRYTASKLPTAVRFGGAYITGKKDFSYAIAVEGYKIIDGGVFHINGGGEIGYKDLLFFRAGYQTGFDNKGFTTGLGLKYKAFNLDYAFIPYSEAFGTSNTISLGFNF